MLRWKNVPMAYFLFPLVLGIAACDHWWAHLSWLMLPFAAVDKKWRTKIGHWLLFFLLGLTLTISDDRDLEHCRYIDDTGKQRSLVVHSMKSRGQRHSVTTWSHSDQCWILATVKGDSDFFVASGDTISFDSPLYRPPPPANPFEFDYAKYLESRDILWCASVTVDELTIDTSHQMGILRAAQFSHRMLSKQFNRLTEHPLTAGLCKAILLGDKEALSEDQQAVFRSTGTMHIMAVSGLHVGMIAGLLLLVLPTTRDRYRGFVKLVIYLLAIWGFVLVTGARSSAIRAGTMFTLFFLSNWIRRDGHAINSLLTAALLILVIDPDHLYDIGSQFSFTAVLSILLFQPWIVVLITPASTVAKYIWEIASVTLSVQVLLAPLSIFYFHTFPITFLISNLIAIPMAGGTLTLSVIYLLTEMWSEDMSGSISDLLAGFTSLCFKGLSALSNYATFNIENIWMEPLQVGLFFLMITLMARGMILKNPKTFHKAMIVMILFFGSIAWMELKRIQSSGLIVYGYPLTGKIDIRSGQKWVSIADGNAKNMSSWRSFYHCPDTIPVLSPDSSWRIRIDSVDVMKLGSWPVTKNSCQDIVISDNSETLIQYLCESEDWPDQVVYIDKYRNAPLEEFRQLAPINGTDWHNVAEYGCFELYFNHLK